MIKRTITYKDFLGNNREDEYRFNLTEDEMMDLVKEDELFSPDHISHVMEIRDGIEMYRILRRMILASYGVLSEDGKVFRKPAEALYDFAHSAAYTQLLDDLTNTEDFGKLRSFIMGIIPAKYAERLANDPQVNAQVAAITGEVVR